MEEGYIMLQVMPNQEAMIIQDLEEMKSNSAKSIKQFHVLLGKYDILVHVDAETEESFLSTQWAIASLEGVKDTETLMVMPKDFVINQLR